MSLTNAQLRYLKKLIINMQPAGVGTTRRVQRALVSKGLARWVSNKNIAAICKDDDADWIIANVSEARRALEACERTG